MDFGRVAKGAKSITVKFGVSQISLRGRKKENHYVYSLASEQDYWVTSFIERGQNGSGHREPSEC